LCRYVFIFWLKNPAAFHHEFWSCFLKVWVALSSGLAQFVFYLMLGEENQYFFICTGTYPAESAGANVRKPFLFVTDSSKTKWSVSVYHAFLGLSTLARKTWILPLRSAWPCALIFD
jgi:hypothetical protein